MNNNDCDFWKENKLAMRIVDFFKRYRLLDGYVGVFGMVLHYNVLATYYNLRIVYFSLRFFRSKLLSFHFGISYNPNIRQRETYGYPAIEISLGGFGKGWKNTSTGDERLKEWSDAYTFEMKERKSELVGKVADGLQCRKDQGEALDLVEELARELSVEDWDK